jgi:hypothetical protein
MSNQRTDRKEKDMQTVDRSDMDVRLQGDGVDFRTKAVGGQTMAWVVLPKGADLGPALKGLEGDACQCPHWGYVIKGRLMMRTNDGERTYEAGHAFYWGPGHVPVALEDCEYIDVSPTDELEAVISHVTGQG